MLYQQNFLIGKKDEIVFSSVAEMFHQLFARNCKKNEKEIFIAVIFYVFDIYIYIVNFIKKIIEKNFVTKVNVSP